LRECRSVGILVDMRGDNTKMELEGKASATAVWAKISFKK
jgi:hypothetical protein